jgi:hypothetical protein
MKPKTDMTPGVIGTALAAVAAGSLVLFSLVLQQSAFDTSFTDGLKAISPSESEQGINVAAAPEVDDSAGEGPGTETPPSEGATEPTPTTEIDTFSPIDGDDGLVASIDDQSDDDEFASGETGNSVNGGGTAETAEADGPQATISKDPNGRPDDVTLPDRNGPKNTSPSHGSDDDSGDDRDDDSDDDRADDDRDRPKNDKQKARAKGKAKNDKQKSGDKGKAKNDKQKSGDKGKAKNDKQKSGAKGKPAKKDTSKDKSAHDKQTAKPNDRGKSNGGGGDSGRDNRSGNGDREPKDRNDRHDTRKDPDDGEDQDHDDDDDRDDDSGHSNDNSGGHSKSRGPKR